MTRTLCIAMVLILTPASFAQAAPYALKGDTLGESLAFFESRHQGDTTCKRLPEGFTRCTLDQSIGGADAQMAYDFVDGLMFSIVAQFDQDKFADGTFRDVA